MIIIQQCFICKNNQLNHISIKLTWVFFTWFVQNLSYKIQGLFMDYTCTQGLASYFQGFFSCGRLLTFEKKTNKNISISKIVYIFQFKMILFSISLSDSRTFKDLAYNSRTIHLLYEPCFSYNQMRKQRKNLFFLLHATIPPPHL